MTVEQVGDNSTLKGDPTFMQDMNTAWHKADQATKNSLKNAVHLDAAGKVVRIDAIKGNPGLEKLVRTFADGKTYVGEGAWQGSPGKQHDNAQVRFNLESPMLSSVHTDLTISQSSAAHGDKDLLVTYSDGDARPDGAARPAQKVVTGKARTGVRMALAANKPAAAGAQQGDHDDGKAPGIILSNKSHKDETFFFFDNYWNGNGTAGANFDHPLKSVTVRAGSKAFVSLPTTFKGRVQRGKLIPATWVEFQISASNDHAAHGDVSVEQGNDGGATIASTDGRKSSAGFTGPTTGWGDKSAWVTRADGAHVLASTMGNWMGGPNQAAIDAQKGRIGKEVYVTGGTGVPDVASKNQRLAVDFY